MCLDTFKKINFHTSSVTISFARRNYLKVEVVGEHGTVSHQVELCSPDESYPVNDDWNILPLMYASPVNVSCGLKITLVCQTYVSW